MVVFILTSLLTVFLFYKAAGHSKPALIVLLAWLSLQGGISATGFYTDTMSLPPRFALLILPPMIVVIVLLFTRFTKQLDARWVTFLHVVRIPVELVLYMLFLAGSVPERMTFTGGNPDILSGLTAPFIWVYWKRLPRGIIIAWNICCLLLLINIVATAILSASSPFQQLGFEQPNTAVVHFPYVWLPCCIVPRVLYAHLAVLLHRRALLV